MPCHQGVIGHGIQRRIVSLVRFDGTSRWARRACQRAPLPSVFRSRDPWVLAVLYERPVKHSCLPTASSILILPAMFARRVATPSTLARWSRAASSAPRGLSAVLDKKPDDVVITFAKRTAMGRARKGQLKDTPVDELLHALFKARSFDRWCMLCQLTITGGLDCRRHWRRRVLILLRLRTSA